MSLSPPLAELSAVKLALMARKARQQAAPILQADPIAIIGMACRAPGGADSPERLWELLREGRDAVREVPADRWNADAWFDPDPSASAKAVTKQGGFIGAIDGFDAAYFNILPREAERMDPQQRLLLEVAIEGIDDAGLVQERLRGTRTGVFVASYHNDYAGMQYGDLEAVDARTLTGTLHSVLTNRLSYFLDLRGPSISIDTACSSSLVAIHMACQSLRIGETELALAGGVSLMISPELMVSMSKVGFMSPDGRCKTFDAGADGFGRGEGCGMVVLKRLSDAIADGDRVHAVIRGSAVNSDGHSTLLAAPSGPAQQAMIREALCNGQLSPERIGYVEAHGTGTALGDPIEVEALAATVGRPFAGAGKCYLGSAKANLGHLEAAAGVTGLIKSVLVLQHGAVPPQVHYKQINPHIDLDGTRLAIPSALVAWPRGEQRRCAAVSSFGVGGTNAHVIIEESDPPPAPDSTAEGSLILPLSAKTPGALRALAQAWLPFIEATATTASDLCSTAAQRRSHYDCRLAVVAGSKSGLRDRLAQYLRDADPEERMAEAPYRSGAPRVGFVFSGQGPQWYAMGRELLSEEPEFRAVVTQCDARLRQLAGWSLLDLLAASEHESRLGETEIAQPALFAVQAGLAALLRSWGLVPDAVVGHSVGEIAALHVAGALTLDEALEVVWRRGRIMQAATGSGCMASVGLSQEEAHALLRPHGKRLSVAAVNGPHSVVISGDADALESALAELDTRGVEHRMLPVRYAFHSAQMEPFRQRLADELASLRVAKPALPFYSTVTGALATSDPLDGAYFAANMRETVRFASAIGAMAQDGCSVFVEIGPHPVLTASISQCLEAEGRSALVTGSLRRGRAERETLLHLVSSLYVAGCSPDWESIQPEAGQVLSLPAYPWQRQRYWIRPAPPRPGPATPIRSGGHPLLGRSRPVAGVDAQIFEGESAGEQAWLADHRIFGALPMPAAAVLEIFHAAALCATRDASPLVGAFTMHRPMFLAEAGAPGPRWQCIARPGGGDSFTLELHEVQAPTDDAEQGWRLIASATAEAGSDPAGSGTHADHPLLADASAGEPLDPGSLLTRFAALGVNFGPHFQCLQAIRRSEGAAQGRIELPAGLRADAGRWGLHPVVVDAALQLCSVAAPPGPAGEVPAAVALPLGIDRFRIRRPALAYLIARARVTEVSPSGSFAADVTLETESGELVAAIEGARFAPARPDAFIEAPKPDEALYDVAWEIEGPSLAEIPAPARSPASADPAPVTRSPGTDEDCRDGAGGLWLLFADGGGLGDAVGRQLQAEGARVCMVEAGADFRRISSLRWMIDPAEPEHFRRLLSAGEVAIGEPLRGVVHLWSLDIPALDGRQDLSLEQDDLLGVGSCLHLAQALLASGTATPPVWMVSCGAQVATGEEPAHSLRPRAAGIWGLGSVIAVEHPELDARLVDLDPQESGSPAAGLLAELLRAEKPSRSLAIRGAARLAPRLKRYQASSQGRATFPGLPSLSQPLALSLVRPGTLDGVELVAKPPEPLREDEVRVRVLAGGLNFRDVLLTLGMYPGADVPLGAECAGIVCEAGAHVSEFALGDRVFGFAPGALATEVVVPAAFLAPVPQHLDAQAAAGLPVAFLTADYGLHRLAALRAGERILIHAAAGGVGLAAVQLARRCGAEVFATAGSEQKRALLRSMGVARVMDSRSLHFADEIREATGGRGVDVVLNSLAGDFIPASLAVLGTGGRFLELGKRDIMTTEDAARARPDVRYFAYDLGSEAMADKSLVRPMLDRIVTGLEDGSLAPLPVTVFTLEHAPEAFRYMAQARHVGKIVLRPGEEGDGPATGVDARPRVMPSATYWVTGGLGGLGLETARWLVGAGARNLVLTGRHPPTAAALEKIRALQAQGARVTVHEADASDREQMQVVLDSISAGDAPLRGVIHAAGVVDDAILMRQTWQRCRAVMQGKADGAWMLHDLTRGIELDFFVLYSAAGVLLGASGQGGYAAANACLDALARARRRSGLPALSVAWGPWADVGMAAGLAARGVDPWSALGLDRIAPDQGTAHLQRLLRDGATYAAVMPMRWPALLAVRSSEAHRAFFQAMASRPAAGAPAASAVPVPAAAGASALAALRAMPASRQRHALLDHLKERSLQVLGLAEGTALDPKLPLKEAGLDSLMAVELRNALTRSLGRPLPATLLFDYPTLDRLADYLVRVLEIGGSTTDMAPGQPPAAAVRDPVDELAGLSDEEAEALLLEELELDGPGVQAND